MIKKFYEFFNNIFITMNWKFGIYNDEGKKNFSLGNVPNEIDFSKKDS